MKETSEFEGKGRRHKKSGPRRDDEVRVVDHGSRYRKGGNSAASKSNHDHDYDWAQMITRATQTQKDIDRQKQTSYTNLGKVLAQKRGTKVPKPSLIDVDESGMRNPYRAVKNAQASYNATLSAIQEAQVQKNLDNKTLTQDVSGILNTPQGMTHNESQPGTTPNSHEAAAIPVSGEVASEKKPQFDAAQLEYLRTLYPGGVDVHEDGKITLIDEAGDSLSISPDEVSRAIAMAEQRKAAAAFESDVPGSVFDDMYTDAAGISYAPGDEVEKPKKPHLNNAESIAYLKQVQEMRAKQREARTQHAREEAQVRAQVLEEEEGGGTAREVEDVPHSNAAIEASDPLRTRAREEAQLRAQILEAEEQGREPQDRVPVAPDISDDARSERVATADDWKTDPKVQEALSDATRRNREQLSQLNVSIRNGELLRRAEAQSQRGVDIELPLDGAQSAERQPARSYSQIQDEIKYIERIKSEIAYGSTEFHKRYPDFAKEYDGKRRGLLYGGNDAAAHMWIERKLQALKAEARATPSERGGEKLFDERFATEFGISREALEKMEGFERLTREQQALVFDNLKEYAEESSQGRFGALWDTVRKTMGQSVEDKPRKGARGIESYQKFLSGVILGTAMYGPRAHIENGKAFPDFVGIQFNREHRKEQKEVCDALNKAAHAFARIPGSWQDDGNGVHAKNERKITTFFKEKFMGGTESRKQFRTYEAAERAYRKAKEDFARVLTESGATQSEIARKLIEIDGKVHQLRFIETDPTAADILKSIPSTSFWEKAKSAGKAGVVYAGLGTVARTMTGNALQVASGPAVAASLAGIRSWNKTAAEQRERDQRARMGIADTSAGALNIVAAKQEVRTSEGVLENGLTGKLRRAVAAYRALGENATPQERADRMGKLKARFTYSYDKFALNRIQFGDKDSFAVNQADFLEALAEAQILISEAELEKQFPKSGVEERLRLYLNYRENAINDRRHAEARKRIAVASSVAAATSVAGALATHQFIASDAGKRAAEYFKNHIVDNSGTPGSPDAATQSTSGETEAFSNPVSAAEEIPVPEPDRVSEPPLPTDEEIGGKEEVSAAPERLIDTAPSAEEFRTQSPDTIATDSTSERLTSELVSDIEGARDSAEISPVVGTSIETLSDVPPTPEELDKARVLEQFIKGQMTQGEWNRARRMDANKFIAQALERGTQRRLSESTLQIGRALHEIGRPPFNVDPYNRETVESFLKRTSVALAQADSRGIDTSTIRGYLTNIKRDWGPIRYR